MSGEKESVEHYFESKRGLREWQDEIEDRIKKTKLEIETATDDLERIEAEADLVDLEEEAEEVDGYLRADTRARLGIEEEKNKK